MSAPRKNYNNLNEIESELVEIQKRTQKHDPKSAYHIAMTAKYNTLTKRLGIKIRNLYLIIRVLLSNLGSKISPIDF